jgi:Kef-type K+ transport system membrane component KefB
MTQNIWFIAALWMGLAGSVISIWTGISVALVEILVGVVAGNLAVGFEGGSLQIGLASAGQMHHLLQSTEWTNFLALLGSGVLTFLAGAEIDPISLKSNWRASVFIGVLSFAIPFIVVWSVAQFVLVGRCTRRKSRASRFPRLRWQWFTP